MVENSIESSIPNIHGLNPKSLRSVNTVKVYVLLKAISPWDGLAAPLVFLENIRLMPAPGSSLALPHLITIVHTLHHNTTLTHLHSS